MFPQGDIFFKNWIRQLSSERGVKRKARKAAEAQLSAKRHGGPSFVPPFEPNDYRALEFITKTPRSTVSFPPNLLRTLSLFYPRPLPPPLDTRFIIKGKPGLSEKQPLPPQQSHIGKHQSLMSQSTLEQQKKAAAASAAAQQSDNIAHALSGAGGGILSMALTCVHPSSLFPANTQEF